MNVKIIANPINSIKSEDNSDINKKAQKIDSHNLIPLLSRTKSSKNHHNKPRSKTFIQKKFGTILRNRFSGSKQPHNWYANHMKIILHLCSFFIDKIQKCNE